MISFRYGVFLVWTEENYPLSSMLYSSTNSRPNDSTEL